MPRRCGAYLVLLLSVVALAAPAHGQLVADPDTAGRTPIQASDLFRIRQIDDLRVSPNGREIAYTVKTVVPGEEEGDFRYDQQLFMTSAAGRDEPRKLTRGVEPADQPVWHPDGDRLAFTRQVDGVPQVFILPLFGGESFQVTGLEHGARDPRWSPDGTRLLVASTLPMNAVQEMMGRPPRWSDERPGRRYADVAGIDPDPDGTLAEKRAWLEANAADGSPRVFTRLDFQDELDLAPTPVFRHLFVVDPVENADPVRITGGYFSFQGGEWLADGERVIFSGSVDTGKHPDRQLDSDLFVVNVDGSGFTQLLDLEGYAVSRPTVSPDGQWVAYTARALRDYGYQQVEIGIVGLAEEEGDPELLTLEFDRSAGMPRWSQDGWHLYFTAPSNGGFPLYRARVFDPPDEDVELPAVEPAPEDTAVVDAVPDTTALSDTTAVADTSAVPSDTTIVVREEVLPDHIERLTGYGRGVGSFDLGRATVFYVVTQPDNPFEIYASSFEFQNERRMTSHNADWLAGRVLSDPAPHHIVRDSLAIAFWVMRPPLMEEGERVPLLVQVHGGPSAMWGPGEATMWHEFQFFAGQGYAVFFSNPRGSGGYGHAFRRANYLDWGAGPAADVLAAASAAVDSTWMDPERQVLTGGSYGGYLTAWIVAHDDRFSAAAAQRGVYDLPTFFGEGNAWRLVPAHFGGYPWEESPPRSDTLGSLLPAPADTLESLLPASPDMNGAVADLLSEGGDTSAVVVDTTVIISPDAVASVEMDEVLRVGVRNLLTRNSPLTYVQRIRTPLLIIHSDADLRTGVSQSEMLYKSLKVLARPVEYIRYPDAGHDLSRTGDPKQRLDRILRLYEFFERFVR